MSLLKSFKFMLYELQKPNSMLRHRYFTDLQRGKVDTDIVGFLLNCIVLQNKICETLFMGYNSSWTHMEEVDQLIALCLVLTLVTY